MLLASFWFLQQQEDYESFKQQQDEYEIFKKLRWPTDNIED